MKIKNLFESVSRLLYYRTPGVFSRITIENTRIFDGPVPQNHQPPRYAFMPSTVFLRTVELLQRMKYRDTIIFGMHGEPLIDDSLVDRLQTIKKLLPLARVFLYTNGRKSLAGISDLVAKYAVIRVRKEPFCCCHALSVLTNGKFSHGCATQYGFTCFGHVFETEDLIQTWKKEITHLQKYDCKHCPCIQLDSL